MFLFAVPFQYINRRLKMSFLLFDLNHSSKQRVHIREVTLQAREFCLKRAINYITLKESGAQNRVLVPLLFTHALQCIQWDVIIIQRSYFLFKQTTVKYIRHLHKG